HQDVPGSNLGGGTRRSRGEFPVAPENGGSRRNSSSSGPDPLDFWVPFPGPRLAAGGLEPASVQVAPLHDLRVVVEQVGDVLDVPAVVVTPRRAAAPQRVAAHVLHAQ